MNLQKLIEKGRLESFDGASNDQIRNKFFRGISFLNIAKKIFSMDDESKDRNAFVHSSVYSALQMIGSAYLLANNYRARGSAHHETVIMACRLIMNDEKLAEVFDRLEIMRKNRNKINYGVDLLDVSNGAIEQAIADVSLFSDKVEVVINAKNSQQKLI